MSDSPYIVSDVMTHTAVAVGHQTGYPRDSRKSAALSSRDFPSTYRR